MIIRYLLLLVFICFGVCHCLNLPVPRSDPFLSSINGNQEDLDPVFGESERIILTLDEGICLPVDYQFEDVWNCNLNSVALLPSVTQSTHSNSTSSPSSVPSTSSPFESSSATSSTSTFIPSTPTVDDDPTISDYPDPDETFNLTTTTIATSTINTTLTDGTSNDQQTPTLCDDFSVNPIDPLTVVANLPSSSTSSPSLVGTYDDDSNETPSTAITTLRSSTSTPTSTLSGVGNMSLSDGAIGTLSANCNIPLNSFLNYNAEMTCGNSSYFTDDADMASCGAGSVSSAIASSSSTIENGFPSYCHNSESIDFYSHEDISIEQLTNDLNEQEQASAFFDSPISGLNGTMWTNDSVHHNHTYATPASSSPSSQRQQYLSSGYLSSIGSKGDASRSSAFSDTSDDDRSITRDEKRAKALNIPISAGEIINLPIDEFNERIAKYDLNETQLALIRDIRRRGKNKVAAQNCRRRKMDQIQDLQSEVGRLYSQKKAFEVQQEQLLALRHLAQEKYTQLYNFILSASESSNSLSNYTSPLNDYSSSILVLPSVESTSATSN